MLTNIAHWGAITIFTLTLIFHLLVLIKVIPYTIVWGGRLKSDRDMYRFEIVSLLLNAIFLLVILFRSGLIASPLSENVLVYILWAMAALFFLNTIGNLFSKNRWEKIIFTPLTLLLAMFAIVMALDI